MQHKPVVKLSRSLGIPLTEKSAKYFERRPFPPGDHGRKRRSQSPYAEQLLEKQRLRYQYNITERQLRNAFKDAHRRPGPTGTNLVEDLATRLDAVVYHSGFTRSIYHARQLVTHRHFTVNGQRVNVPAYRLKPGDVIGVVPRSRALTPFQIIAQSEFPGEVPSYLSVARPGLQIRLDRAPKRDEVPVVCDEQLVVEWYAAR